MADKDNHCAFFNLTQISKDDRAVDNMHEHEVKVDVSFKVDGHVARNHASITSVRVPAYTNWCDIASGEVLRFRNSVETLNQFKCEKLEQTEVKREADARESDAEPPAKAAKTKGKKGKGKGKGKSK